MTDFDANIDKIADTLRGKAGKLDLPPRTRGRVDWDQQEPSGPDTGGKASGPYPDNGGPPDISRVAELSARGIDKIATETADQIREVGEAAVTHAEALRAEANALADSIVEQGRKFSDRVVKFSNTAEAMMGSLNDQRARFNRDN